MKSLDSKLIIYDSHCKVCSSLRDVVLKFTSIPAEKIKAYRELDQDLSRQVDPEKFKNVMALIDTAGGKTIYGAEGIAYIFSSQCRIADFLFRFRPIFQLFTFLYKTQAYNRYIIATPKSRFKCDCFPDRVVKYRISYIAITMLISIFLGALFGMTIRDLLGNASKAQASLQILLMAGSGWILHVLLAVVTLKHRALDYVGHLGSIMVMGALILIPWMLWYAATGIINPYLLISNVVLSSGYMVYLHIVRVRYLALSQGWTLAWFLIRPTAALFWIHFFSYATH